MAKISTLTDDFEDGVIDAVLWATAGTVSESSGRAVLTPSTSGVLSGLLSNAFYDLTFSSITAQVPVVTATGISGSLQCALAVMIDNNNVIALRKIGANLYASYTVSGVATDNFAAAYNSTNHLYWRIRADSSNIYWETSATGSGTFTIQATQNISAIFPVLGVRAYLYAFYSGVEPSPGSFRIEAINPGQQLRFVGASTSTGQLSLRRVLGITLSGASSSTGTLAWTIPPLTAHSFTATATSSSTGSLALIKVSAGNMMFAGTSASSGSLSFSIQSSLSFFGQSFATGQLSLSIIAIPTDPLLIQYFIFEPPIVYDRPAVHSKTPRHVRKQLYYSAHSLGATGVSVLKIDGQFQSIQTPSVDQMDSASVVYQGGHIYTINQSDADELSSAGYTVIPLPVPVPLMTLYPGDDIFPADDLYPGYQETVLV